MPHYCPTALFPLGYHNLGPAGERYTHIKHPVDLRSVEKLTREEGKCSYETLKALAERNDVGTAEAHSMLHLLMCTNALFARGVRRCSPDAISDQEIETMRRG